MKRTVIFLLATLVAISSFAQEVYVTQITINNDYPRHENNQRLSFQLAIITDISTFTYNLDHDKTVITEIKDDTGFDLLAAQMAYAKKREASGFSYIDSKIQRGSPVESGGQTGIYVSASLGVVPEPGANKVNIKGVVAMVHVAETEQEYTLKDIPTENNWGPGVATAIGEVKVSSSGSFESEGGISFTSYQVTSINPITSMKITGGDDREEAAKYFKLNLYGNEMIFKEIPEKLELVVIAKDTEVKEIPFDIDLTLGY